MILTFHSIDTQGCQSQMPTPAKTQFPRQINPNPLVSRRMLELEPVRVQPEKKSYIPVASPLGLYFAGIVPALPRRSLDSSVPAALAADTFVSSFQSLPADSVHCPPREKQAGGKICHFFRHLITERNRTPRMVLYFRPAWDEDGHCVDKQYGPSLGRHVAQNKHIHAVPSTTSGFVSASRLTYLFAELQSFHALCMPIVFLPPRPAWWKVTQRDKTPGNREPVAHALQAMLCEIAHSSGG